MLIKDKNFTVPMSDTAGFNNPMAPERSVADPTVLYDRQRKCWYLLATGNKSLTLCRAERFADLGTAGESRVIYEASDADGTVGSFWAPELHFLDGKWYIYTSTENPAGKGGYHLFVLRANTDDPMDGFSLAGHLAPQRNAIDPTVYRTPDGKLLLCCAFMDTANGRECLLMQEMASPTALKGEGALLSTATLPWELDPTANGGVDRINEGPYFLPEPESGRLFLVYSANGCMNDDYLLGILELKGDDPLDPACWEKDTEPFFTKGNGCFGPGHASFFTSPDGKEIWMACHRLDRSNPTEAPMPRRLHCQRVFFDATGFPHVGEPAAYSPLPGGSL